MMKLLMPIGKSTLRSATKAGITSDSMVTALPKDLPLIAKSAPLYLPRTLEKH